MRNLLVHTTVILLALGIAGAAAAAQLQYSGSIGSKIGARPINVAAATGVAEVNMSGGGGLLHTLRLLSPLTGSNFAPVTDPDTTGQIKTIGFIGTAVTGTLGDFQNPPLTSNKLVLRGVSRLCLLQPCGSSGSINFDVPLSLNGGHTGLGVGGLLTKGGYGTIRISIEAAPWTLGSGTAVNQTQEGGFKTVTASGFIHEAASGTGGGGSTAVTSGVVQLISPMQVTTLGLEGNISLQSAFVLLKLRFIPEPGLLLLLGAGVVGLGILGRNRMRR